jgi:nitrite reductase/ring-hydroxylating ferredoxin subunit
MADAGRGEHRAAGSEPADAVVHLCASGDLAEKGLALVFDVLHGREPAQAFALRHDGVVVAYLNRCVHLPTEMDWQPGNFLDARREFIVCATHGAEYEPHTGRCVGGPCGRGSLAALRVEERDGQVYWYPSCNTRPAFDDAPGAHESPA